MQRRITVRAIIVNDSGKLFAVRHKASGGKSKRNYWCTPGGHIDMGESLVPALEREMLEETAIKPQTGRLLYVQQYADAEDNEEQIEFFFHVTNTADYKNIDLADATHAGDEIAEHGFVDTKAVTFLPKFLAEEDVLADIKSNAPVKFFSYLR